MFYAADLEDAGNRARRLAGYKAQERPLKRDRHDLISMMLNEISRDSKPEVRILKLDALMDSYFGIGTPKRNVEFLMQVIRIYEKIKQFTPELRADTFARIHQLLDAAKGAVATTEPTDEATIIFPKAKLPPVMLDTQIQIEYREPNGDVVWYGYRTTNIEMRDDSVVAQIRCVGNMTYSLNIEE